MFVSAIITSDAAAAVLAEMKARGWVESALLRVIAQGEGPLVIEEATRAATDLLLVDVRTGPGLAQGLTRFRIARPAARIVLLASGCTPGDPEVARVVGVGVYNIVDSLDRLSAAIDHEPLFEDAARWLDPSLAPGAPASSAGPAEVRVVERTAVLHRPQLIAVFSGGIGGAGKSTVTYCLAQEAAARGYRPLVIDLDQGQPTQARLWDVDPGPGIEGIPAEAWRSEEALRQVLPSVTRATRAGVSVLPAHAHGTLTTDDLTSAGALFGAALRSHDLVLADCGARLEDLPVFAALQRADVILLVTEPTKRALDGALSFLTDADDFGLPRERARLVLNKVARTGLSLAFVEQALELSAAAVIPFDLEGYRAIFNEHRPYAPQKGGQNPWPALAGQLMQGREIRIERERRRGFWPFRRGAQRAATQ